ncbi:hypothetical protein MKHDV_01309 [Halodesulfovibrio sp. MK-HDV]|jgi:hypothetical protein|nr:hypothetical protein MKHDV_01309 [Halodesulfovibrio sp. MK-HDV]
MDSTNDHKRTRRQYRDDLKFLVELGNSEYLLYETDMLDHQHNLIKTYLWVASIIFTAQTSFYLSIIKDDFKLLTTFTPMKIDSISTPYYLLLILSLYCAVCVFLFAVDTLRGRNTLEVPYKNFETEMVNAYDDAFENDSFELYQKLLTQLETSINQRSTLANCNGLKLRKMSQLLLTSAVTGLFSIAFLLLPIIKISLSSLIILITFGPTIIGFSIYFIIKDN